MSTCYDCGLNECGCPPINVHWDAEKFAPLLTEAEARGYQRAIDALRDRKQWAKWCASTVIEAGEQRIDVRQPTDAADYLESTGRSATADAEPAPRVIDDGLGNVWPLCHRQTCYLEIVRPGKVQCRCDEAWWSEDVAEPAPGVPLDPASLRLPGLTDDERAAFVHEAEGDR